MTIRQYILEATYNITQDVDYIYNKFFKNRLKAIRDQSYQFPILTGSYNIVLNQMMSIELRSVLSKKASQINPVLIQVGFFPRGAFYDPLNKVINLTIHYSASNVLNQYNYDYESIEKNIGKNKFKSLLREFSEEAVKSTIYHELAHWIDDSLHNLHISKEVQRMKDTGKGISPDISSGVFSVTSAQEIEGQIHGIKQMKRVHKKDWDELSFSDMLLIKPGMAAMVVKLIREGGVKSWLRAILPRMYREGLLGANMKTSVEELEYDLRTGVLA